MWNQSWILEVVDYTLSNLGWEKCDTWATNYNYLIIINQFRHARSYSWLFFSIDMEPIPIAEMLFHGWGQDTLPNTRIKKRSFKLLDKCCETEEQGKTHGRHWADLCLYDQKASQILAVREGLVKTSCSVKKGETPKRKNITNFSHNTKRIEWKKSNHTSKKKDFTDCIDSYPKPNLIRISHNLTYKALLYRIRLCTLRNPACH